MLRAELGLSLFNIFITNPLPLGRILSAALIVIGFLILYLILKKKYTNTHRKNLDEKSLRHNICDFQSKGKSLSEIISDHEKYDCIILDELSLKDGFLDITIKNDDQLYENVSFSYSTKDEINKRYNNKSIISEPIELNTEKDVNKFLIDEYKNLYLLEKTGKNSKIYQITRSEDPYLEQSKDWLEASQNLRKSKFKLIERDQNDCKLDFIFQDLEDSLYHLISMDLEYNIVKYRASNDLTNSFSEKNQDELTELSYSHGLEIELQLVKEDWSLIEGDRIENVYEGLLENTRKKLERLRKDAPDYIKNNWSGEIKKDIDDKGCLTLHIQYALEGKIRQYSIFGKDSHVSLKTNILEIQTPPCKCIEEIEWWTFNLYRIAYEVVEESGLDISILPLGSNPVDDYSRGVTFGEHHHIYIQDKKLRKDVYNVLRSLVPYLIAVSSNSPFNEKRIPEYAFNNNDNLVILESAYTNRLNRNKEQFSVPPFLPPFKGKDFFENKLKRTNESSRMVDVFPFTRFDTIEVRVFDTQLTTIDRVLNVVLLQSIISYVEDSYDRIKLQKISSDLIKNNRHESIRNGFFGRFNVDKNLEQIFEIDESRSFEYLFQMDRLIIRSLWSYITEMELEESKYAKLLLLKHFDIISDELNQPISNPQFLIYLSCQYEFGFDELMEKILDISQKSIFDLTYHPLFENLDIDENKYTKIKNELRLEC